VKGRRGRRHRKLLDDLQEKREGGRSRSHYRFERGLGPVVRQTTK